MTALHFEEYVPVPTYTLHELVETYFLHHAPEHRTDHGIKRAFKLLAECFPNADTSTFGKKNLLFFQNFLTDKYDRHYCNRLITFIRRVFKWGALFDLVSVNLSHELTLIPPLRIGDRRCRENKKRLNVPTVCIDNVLPLLRPVIADMLRLQRLHAMRPSEVCNIKASMIDFNYKGGNWLYLPEEHKTAGAAALQVPTL